MKCEAAMRDIALAVYGELPDDVGHRLENHVAECERCAKELEAVQTLHRAMSLLPVEEPSPNLIAKARLSLEEALDSVPRSGWLTRIVSAAFRAIGSVQAAPVMASTVLVFGLVGGGYAGYRVGTNAPSPKSSVIVTAEAGRPNAEQPIASVQSVVQQPNSEVVDIRYSRLVPETAHGSLDDPAIRHLLVLAAQSRINEEARANSVNLLAEECKAGHQCDLGPSRDALLVALLYDKAPSVRSSALDGLEPYVGEDLRVRNAVLHTLMKDPDPKVRTKAIGVLKPVESDTSVRRVLHKVADTDENPYLRTVSRQVIDGLPEIQ